MRKRKRWSEKKSKRGWREEHTESMAMSEPKGRRKESQSEYRKRSKSRSTQSVERSWMRTKKEREKKKTTTNIRTINKYKQTSYQTASVNDPVWIYFILSLNERAPAATEAHTIPNNRTRESVCVCVCSPVHAMQHVWATIEWGRRKRRKCAQERESESRQTKKIQQIFTYALQCQKEQKVSVRDWAVSERLCFLFVTVRSCMHMYWRKAYSKMCTHNAHINQLEFMRSNLHERNERTKTTSYDYIISLDLIRCTGSPCPFSLPFFCSFCVSHAYVLALWKRIIVTKIVVMLCVDVLQSS